jgi:hypothetical protein
MLQAAHTDRIIREAVSRLHDGLDRPRSAEQEARAQIAVAIASLKHSAELRRYNLRCFPGIYRRDLAVYLRSSVARLEFAAKRRRYAADLLAWDRLGALPSTSEQKAA